MISIEDLLAEEAQLRRSPSPRRGPRSILLAEQEDASIKLISRERLLRYDGEELVSIVCKSLTGRDAALHTRIVLAGQLRSGNTTKRYIYDAFLREAQHDWQPLSGRGWILNQAAAETLTLGEWLRFSARFAWFRIGRLFRKTWK